MAAAAGGLTEAEEFEAAAVEGFEGAEVAATAAAVAGAAGATTAAETSAVTLFVGPERLRGLADSFDETLAF